MVSIRDVAKKSGFSVSTVSNVINGRVDQMSKSTLERIETCIKELGYRPNRSAQQLKSGHVKMIGVLVPSIMNPNFAILVNELEEIARQKYGYQIILGNTNRQDQQEELLLEDMSSFGIRGAIVVSANTKKDHFIKALDNGMHLISYDGLSFSDEASLLMDSVSLDNFKAGFMATSFLLDQKLDDLVFVSIKGDIVSRHNKIEGFKAALAQRGINQENRLLMCEATSDYGDAELSDLGKKAAARLLKERKALPQGIVVLNDMLALGMISYFQTQGIKVPQDISIVGIDNIFMSSLMSPALTTIASPINKIADLLLKRLIARVEGQHLKPKEFLYSPKLICRDSVKVLKR